MKVKRSQFGFSAFLVLVVVGLGIVIVGVITYFQLRLTPQIQPPPIPKTTQLTQKDETADCETYKNEEYGYEVKYPKDWYVYDEDSANVYFQKGKEEEMEFETQPFGPHSQAIKISAMGNPSNLSAKEWVVKEIHNGVTVGSEEEIIIGNIKGIKIVPICEDIYCEYPIAYVVKGSKIYRFDQQISGKPKVFNQMLSTFKFLD